LKASPDGEMNVALSPQRASIARVFDFRRLHPVGQNEVPHSFKVEGKVINKERSLNTNRSSGIEGGPQHGAVKGNPSSEVIGWPRQLFRTLFIGPLMS
jgi:hypothetical protein